MSKGLDAEGHYPMSPHREKATDLYDPQVPDDGCQLLHLVRYHHRLTHGLKTLVLALSYRHRQIW